MSGDVPTAEQTPAEPTPDVVAEEIEVPPAAPATAEDSRRTPQRPSPRAAVPAVVHDLPGADASVDLGVSPLTRRQARQQERIRTASVPVITPEVAAAHAASRGRGGRRLRPEQLDTNSSGDAGLARLFGSDAASTSLGR